MTAPPLTLLLVGANGSWVENPGLCNVITSLPQYRCEDFGKHSALPSLCSNNYGGFRVAVLAL